MYDDYIFQNNNNLHMFISSNDDIIEMLTAGDHDDFGSEKLKSLMKLLPETEEVNLREKEPEKNDKNRQM